MPCPARLQLIHLPGNITVINDAFNANPESMSAGLHTFADYSGDRRMAVLGEMRELGPGAQAAHEVIGRLVAELGIHLLVTVGHGHADDIARASQASSAPPFTENTETPEDLLARLPALLKPDEVVFIKASRSVGLEHLAALLVLP